MSFRTIEVDVVNGHVQPTGKDQLPDRAHGLLTLLDEAEAKRPNGELSGLKRFLDLPSIASTAEQVRASLEEDYYEQ